MNLNEAVDQIAARLDAMPGYKIFPYPPESITPPCLIVSYPDQVEYDLTNGRGTDQVKGLVISAVVGKVTSLAARRKVMALASGGTNGIKSLIESQPFPAFDDVQVTTAQFDEVTIADVDYITVTFTCDITGRGA